MYHIGDHQSDQMPDHAVALKVIQHRSAPVVSLFQDLPERDAVKHCGINHAGAQSIIKIVCGVSQFISYVGDLGLEIATQFRI